LIVLHAGWVSGQVLVWGESPWEQEGVSGKRRGRKPKMPRVEALPYDAGAEALALAIKDAAPEARLNNKHKAIATAWLPTLAGTPIASSPLIAEVPDSKAKPVLAPWKVNSYRLGIGEAVELLIACAGKRTLAPGVIVGEDLAFWSQALRFAGAMVVRQEFLPGLVQKDGKYFARWEPVLVGDESERLSKQARSMPSSARALSLNSGGQLTTPPEVPAASLLSDFLQATVDYLVRSDDGVKSETKTSQRRRRKSTPEFESVHDQWLHALMSPDGTMEGNESELASFAEQVREWQRPVAIAAGAPFRLCFRLNDPGDGHDGEWRVDYLLQDISDPSLLVPAGQAWKARGKKAAVLKREGFNAREYLLSSLGQASGICPRIEKSLKTSAPEGYKLDSPGAYEFLIEKASALSLAGFGVMLPAWWTGKGTKQRLAARAVVKGPKMQGASGLTLSTITEFRWEVALGGKKLTLGELKELARLKSPLVKVRGQWVEMSAEEIQKAIELMEKKAEKAPAKDIMRMALGAGGEETGLDFEGVRATGWMNDLLKQLEGRTKFKKIEAPEQFTGELRPYQLRGYSWLNFLKQWGLGACLADDMGLGKTVQALAMIQRDWHGNGKQPVLIVCPTSVMNNWAKEAARFTPELPVMIHHGVQRKKGKAFVKIAGKQAMVVSSYALLHRDAEFLKSVPWSGVILDEAQNIKNPETKQAKAARDLAAGYRVALTGTPVENNVGELWSLMEFLNPGLLGKQSEFKKRFFMPIQLSRDPAAAQRLKRITGPFILRRLKTDKTIIRDLPEKMEMKVFCNLTKEQASLYAAVLKDVEDELYDSEGIQRKGLILATLMKLKQVCNHPVQFLGDNSRIRDRSGKLARLCEMLEEVIEVGDRALVFSQFAEMGDILKRHLQESFGVEIPFLYGAVPKKKRDKMVERFQSDDGPPIFILSLKAGGLGLNLTRANHVFHFDRWWNPAVENQATDRAFRIGQIKNVQVRKFVCAGTLEEKIDEMIERKKEVAEQVVGAGEGWLTELSNDELKNIFALRKDVVAE